MRAVKVLVFVSGVLVCLAWSWRPSLWTDEAATITASTRSLPQLLAMAQRVDVVHATYYALMHLWLQLFPATAFALRLPSALATGAAAVGVLVLGEHLQGRRVAIGAAAVFILLPRSTWMGVEARSYALTALLAVSATLVLVLVEARSEMPVQRRRRGWLLVAYALLAGLGIASNVYLALLLVSHGLTLLWRRPRDWRLLARWLVASSVGVVLASPVAWTAVHQTGQLGGGAFGWFTWLRNVAVNQWFLGETPTLSTGAASDLVLGVAGVWKLAAVALAVLGWGLVLLGLLRRPRSAVVAWAVPWVLVPTLVIGLYSVTVHNMYSARYFSYATGGMALLVGLGLAQLSRRTATVALLLLAVLAAPVYLSQRQPNAKSSSDWSEVADFVAAHKGPDGGVYFSPRYPITGPTVEQTSRGIAVAYPDAFRGLSDVTLQSTAVEDDNLTGSSVLLPDARARWAGLDTVWVVRRHDYAYAAQDDDVLRLAGFSPGLRWSGPLDEVVEYERQLG